MVPLLPISRGTVERRRRQHNATTRIPASRSSRLTRGLAARTIVAACRSAATKKEGRGGPPMRRVAVAALSTLAVLAGPAEGKTLVFCSELSPENFSPMLATTSTSDTAAARALYGKLFEFELG